MIRFIIFLLSIFTVSAWNVPNESCYDAPGYDCKIGDFNLTENATICRTYATESLNWTYRIRCDGEPFYHCVMARDLYNKEWKRFDCNIYNGELKIACEMWRNIEYCQFNVIFTVLATLIAAGILLVPTYFVFFSNKGNKNQQTIEAYAEKLKQEQEDMIIGNFEPYKDEIKF